MDRKVREGSSPSARTNLPLLQIQSRPFVSGNAGTTSTLKLSKPATTTAVLAFGFVHVHPFVDGNGRLHRYLIHRVLAQRGFSPAGVVFPVSAAIVEPLDEYRAVLQAYSQPLPTVIDWRPTHNGIVNVLNDTADLYRSFDATPHAEFLYACVKQTIEEHLPRETEFLKRYDQFRVRVEAIVDMPERE